ncbi:YncE family protein [Nocardioides sp. cx-173]|uniref:YncE family protein n=1 Tax=Nocardioides sp. cx-173 TaxID=2898796 RepID=UPI001E3B87DF|nr:YncE family protein [Nocardioides sp. cx-173]MCD4523465.1 YncE family protein [Nocardioides sp. cx-173]UGB42196.1 YncE family protein [Nocardioides sp. cx-173]
MTRSAARRATVAALGAALALTGLVAATAPAQASSAAPVVDEQRAKIPPGVRRVVFVGNNWDGTADLLAPGTFKRLARINVIPDYDARMQEIATNPYRLAYFLAIRALIGEGHDQFVDDMYSSNDGRLVVISRPSFGDVVAISLRTREIVWRFAVDGVRSDHMAVSPDGRRVVVSASTGNVVHVLRVRDGKELGRFPSGGSPHESVFIDGGRRILHASIGMVYSPLDDPALDATKDDRVLQIVDARTYRVLRRYHLRKALDERGLDDVSTAVRPMTLSPDEKKIYFQLSFFHGYVQLDRRTGRITRVRRLPNLVPDTPREAYLLDSAHHGIAMNPRGTKLCVAGTMSDYATVVDARSGRHSRLIKGGLKPYWATPSWDGRYCYVSWSGSDTVSRISYATARIVSTTKVGDHPQRVRNGVIRRAFLARPASS